MTVEVPGQRFEDGPTFLSPLGLGAHNWHPMSYSPRSGLLYIPAQDVRALMEPASSYTPENRNFSTGMVTDSKTHNAQLTQTMLRRVMQGYLLAWNPKTQTSAWEVERPGLSNGGKRKSIRMSDCTSGLKLIPHVKTAAFWRMVRQTLYCNKRVSSSNKRYARTACRS